jgi:hypothetical protein
VKASVRALPLPQLALVAVLVAVLAVLATVRQERDAQPEQDTYSSYDALPGGYRAWHALLGREGVDAARFEERPAFLDGSIDTLILAEPPANAVAEYTRGDDDALADWVRSGGRLVLLGRDRSFERDKEARARKEQAGKPPKQAAPARAKPAPEPSQAPVERPVTAIAPEWRAAGVDRLFSADDARYRARPEELELAGDERGALAVRYAYGKGEVVAIADRTLFTNRRIATGDHARLAFLLGTPRVAGARVAFDEAIHGYVTPEHWWAIVPRPLLVAVLLVLGALALALFGAAIRLGPPIAAEPPREPTSAEFIESLAALAARGNASGKALRDTFRVTRRALALALGIPEDAPPERLAARIERADLRGNFLELAKLSESGNAGPAALVRGAALAHRLRKEFGTNVRPRNPDRAELA